MPLMRPLFFEDEEDAALVDEHDLYLWGDAFLVAPITEPGAESVDIDLPDGIWFDFRDDTRYVGGRAASVPVTPESIPVLVRGGSFLPMIDAIATTRDYSSDELILHYYADPAVRSAAGKMYEDDGESRSSLEDGRYELLRFTAAQDNDELVIGLDREGAGHDGMPESRELTVVLHNWGWDMREIAFAGESVPILRRLPGRGNGAVHDRQTSTLTLRIDWNHEPAELRIN
jgi:oligosaccharide 4-alpha-D-glucosyltransferase